MAKVQFGVPQEVNHPITIPTSVRGGVYRDVLIRASKLTATSRERGLQPHLRVPFENADESKKFLSGLSAAMRRAKGRAQDTVLTSVKYMRHNDASNKTFEVYVWNEGKDGAGKKK